MSTRGAIGIRFNNIDKVGYNHFDSYPYYGLGDSVLTFLQNHTIEQIKDIYNKIEFSDSSEDWSWDWDNDCFYSRFYDRLDFLYDSLFCEYAYIINLDSGYLEFYKGFNTDLKAEGRYAKFKSEDDSTYFGVKLVQEIPLEHINDYITYEDENGNVGFKLK